MSATANPASAASPTVGTPPANPLASEQEFRAHIARRIKRSRMALGLTGPELAEMVGVSSNTIYAWELGLRTPNSYHLMRVRDVVIRAGGKW